MEDIQTKICSAFLDVTFSSPQANLDFDEYLLELSNPSRILRIWESKEYFVVMGRNSDESDLNLPAIEAVKIPVLRRKSGGGTVLQGPGCLNYTFVSDLFPQVGSVKGAFEWVLSRLRMVVKEVLGMETEVKGSSDLCLGNRKFSGNAQRRRGNRFYVHGTILYDFDLSLMDRFLLLPKTRPDYRKDRSNQNFLINIANLKEKKGNFVRAMAFYFLEKR